MRPWPFHSSGQRFTGLFTSLREDVDARGADNSEDARLGAPSTTLASRVLSMVCTGL